jgi:MscS family membrane protein
MRLVHVGTDLMAERAAAANRTTVLAMIPLGRKAAKVLLGLMAAIGLLQGIGFNVTGIVAGLGVGGLAVALAAQRTVENLFGGVTLTMDQPVRVGEFCRWGDKLGTVEDVGLRSTRIRTLDRTVITVPNSVISQVEIENYARRDKVRLHTVIGVRYETSPDQLRHVLIEIRKLLAAHPMIDPDPARVRFVGFGASSLELEIFAYVRTSDFNEFLKVREDVYLRIMDVVNSSGTGFAFPSQTLYLGRDGGLDHERKQAAEETVRALRRRGALPFPDLPPDLLAEIEDRLEYPGGSG